MFLLVRDEDARTVATAINAFADEEGLEPIDLAAEEQSPLTMLSVLAGPRALVSTSGDQVVALGLESLDIADADEWGTAISAACETEVIAVDGAPDGVRVYVFDGGELDEEIEVALDPSGRTRAPELVELAESEQGRWELAQGIVAASAEQLVQGVLRCLGVEGPGEDAIVLAFLDPLDEDEIEEEAALVVEALPGAELAGSVGSEIVSFYGSLFAVSLQGADSVTGLRLELSGDGLALLDVDTVSVTLRVRGSHQLQTRELEATTSSEGAIVVDLEDAFLERVDLRPPALDPSDMFATMQRLMSAGESQQLNTMLVGVAGVARRAGEGELGLRAVATSAAVAPGEAGIPVRVA